MESTLQTQHPATNLFDYEVFDALGHKIGKVENIWVLNRDGGPIIYFGIHMEGSAGTRVVPTQAAQIDDQFADIKLPYSKEKIESAPIFAKDMELNQEDQRRIDAYYQDSSLEEHQSRYIDQQVQQEAKGDPISREAARIIKLSRLDKMNNPIEGNQDPRDLIG